MPVSGERGARHERKFLIPDLDRFEVESLVRLHPALFREPYPPRTVNNIYFDSAGLGNYLDNLDGVGDRTKFRIRWYGELRGKIGRPVLEIKRKQGLLGTKRSFPLIAFRVGSELDRDGLRRLFEESDIPDPVRDQVKALLPSLLNRYRRRYFVSADARVRLTLDTEREFFALGPRHNSLVHARRDHRVTILELKYAPADETRAAEIATRFPFRATKSSKYAQGVEAVSLG